MTRNEPSFPPRDRPPVAHGRLWRTPRGRDRSGRRRARSVTVARRAGDVTAAYADTSLANNELGWKAELSLEVALASSWKWQESL